jgi:hypothetical protein
MKNRTIAQCQQFLINNFGKQLAKSDLNEIFVFLFKTDYQTILMNQD